MVKKVINNEKMQAMDKQALKILTRLNRKQYGVCEMMYIISTMLEVMHNACEGDKGCQEVFNIHLDLWNVELRKNTASTKNCP